MKKLVHFLGDSHSLIFKYIQYNYPFEGYLFNVISVDGATASGISNPNSKTNALPIFMNSLKYINKDESIFFMLGEVDCGFTIWHRAKKHNIDVEVQLKQTLNNFFRFLRKIQSMGYSNIYLITPPLPTIEDNQDWGDVANLRKEVITSQIEKTELSLKFNEGLRNICKRTNFILIDTEDNLLDKDTNIIKSYYLNENKLDHHLSNEKSAPLYIKKLHELGFK